MNNTVANKSNTSLNYTLFFIGTHFIRISKLRLGKENKNKLRTKRSSGYVQEEMKTFITKAARYFLKIMFNNGAQFVGLIPRPIKSKVFLDLCLGKFCKISFFLF